ncbi:NERD domain-containing protein [Seohaeicola saemankumensis]|uniref:nuclease-related domain-containing protein n=1 Tax=Seohaeicola saemankumensis TaxID=481181 RepID=UPI001E57A93A|nr:NERD domain-containing protein [Seohaeicola saemankumensis]MCD1626311.1 NERD domain-containing protein [Seohaeicola saemankumensis]
METFLAIVFFSLVAYGLWYFNSPSFKGSVGERRVNSTLERHLPEGYRVFADLTLPSLGGTTQVDHVVVSRFGVFVIETKNMQGWIFGSADQASWTQTIYGRKTRFQNPLRQNFKHVKAIQEALGVDKRRIHNLVVFAGSAEPKSPMPSDVCWNVRGLAHSILTRQEVLFNDSEVAAISEKLARGDFQTTKDAKRAHIQHVKKAANTCPKCGSALVLRANKRTGSEFFGCSQFPKCKGTRLAK